MQNRYVVTWDGGEHVEPNIYLGRSHALNIVEQYVAQLRKDGVTGPIDVRHEETPDGERWNVISRQTV